MTIKMRNSFSEDHKNRIKHDMTSALSYTQRRESKHRAEMALIERSLHSFSDVKTVLDAPCGVGRATVLMAQKGMKATGIDLGEAAVYVARKKAKEAGVNLEFQQGDITNLNFNDMTFDAVLCFRLYHHFPDDSSREPIIAELCRVAQKYVLISYLSPYAFTSIKRSVRSLMGGKLSRQYTTKLGDLENKFNGHGFGLVRDIPQARFRHTLHLAIFKRSDKAGNEFCDVRSNSALK